MKEEKRKYKRFPVSLKVEVVKEGNESVLGLIKDFSREGARVVFNDLALEKDTCASFNIQKPGEDVFIPASIEVVWKKNIKGKIEIGVRLKEFPPQVKSEILEYSYRKWMKHNQGETES